MPLPKKDQEFLEDRTLRFWLEYQQILSAATDIADTRGQKYDDHTPIYYRFTPAELVGEVKKKALRIRTILAQPGWDTSHKALKDMLQEVPDIINYAAFLGATLTMYLGVPDFASSTLNREDAFIAGQRQMLRPGMEVTTGVKPGMSIMTGSIWNCAHCGKVIMPDADWIGSSGFRYHEDCYDNWVRRGEGDIPGDDV